MQLFAWFPGPRKQLVEFHQSSMTLPKHKFSCLCPLNTSLIVTENMQMAFSSNPGCWEWGQFVIIGEEGHQWLLSF